MLLTKEEYNPSPTIGRDYDDISTPPPPLLCCKKTLTSSSLLLAVNLLNDLFTDLS
jgi:hypothetical protein